MRPNLSIQGKCASRTDEPSSYRALPL